MRRLQTLSIILIALLIGAFSTGLYLWTPGVTNEPFIIEAGEGVEEITARLADAGIVRNTLFFRIALKNSGLAKKLQPGSHDLSTAGSYEDVIRLLASGGITAEEVTLLIREGETLSDIANRLTELGHPAAEDFLALTGNPPSIASPRSTASIDLSSTYSMLASKPKNISLEGYLFPNTYRIFIDATAEDIVDMLVGQLAKELAGLEDEIAASGKSIHAIVTLASILEQEVRGETDKRKVADLFWRRINIGMGLQADSTVNYITGKDLAAVTYDDLETESPYNTYKYRGLPPGPIGNPGLESLRAVVMPLANDALFFLTDIEGNVHYANTFDAHVRNKFKYLK